MTFIFTSSRIEQIVLEFVKLGEQSIKVVDASGKPFSKVVYFRAAHSCLLRMRISILKYFFNFLFCRIVGTRCGMVWLQAE